MAELEKYDLLDRPEQPEDRNQCQQVPPQVGFEHLLGMQERNIAKYHKHKSEAQIHDLHDCSIQKGQGRQVIGPVEDTPEQQMEDGKGETVDPAYANEYIHPSQGVL
ncbi:MAG: hypothetical protein QNJ78_01290 [Gammaproteobacteria bacterium]|nr:hypothetical protein [Gammaproteobacteria bacterium]